MKQLSLPKKVNHRFQTRENDIFLNKILKRKRGSKTPRVFFRRYKTLLKIIIPAAILGAGLFYLYRYADNKGFLKIKMVEVAGAEKFVNFDDIKTLAENNSMGKNIIFYNALKLQDLLMANFLGAKSISVEKELPYTIKVVVEERVPLAVLHLSENGSNYLIDGDGYVLGEIGSGFNDLPKVTYEGKVLVGTFVEKDVVPITVEIIKNASQDDLKISSISFYPKYTRLFIGSGTEVLIGNEKDKVKSLDVVSSMLKKLSLEGKKVNKIDLRYDKVIVLYE